MLIATLFWLLFGSSSLLIAITGPGNARLFLIAILIAVLSSAAIEIYLPFWIRQYAYFAIDALLLICALICVSKLNVFWPIWFSGFQIVTVACELGAIILPGLRPALYFDLAGFWSVPALVSMTVGVLLDRRQESKLRR